MNLLGFQQRSWFFVSASTQEDDAGGQKRAFSGKVRGAEGLEPLLISETGGTPLVSRLSRLAAPWRSGKVRLSGGFCCVCTERSPPPPRRGISACRQLLLNEERSREASAQDFIACLHRAGILRRSMPVPWCSFGASRRRSHRHAQSFTFSFVWFSGHRLGS